MIPGGTLQYYSEKGKRESWDGGKVREQGNKGPAIGSGFKGIPCDNATQSELLHYEGGRELEEVDGTAQSPYRVKRWAWWVPGQLFRLGYVPF